MREYETRSLIEASNNMTYFKGKGEEMGRAISERRVMGVEGVGE